MAAAKMPDSRIPELDGIRGLAIGLVLIGHFFLVSNTVRPGTALAYVLATGRLAWTGVDLFFVLSGFLIGGILLDARGSLNYFRVFYTRRFFRIIPAYALCLTSIYAFSWLLRFGFAKNFAWVMDDRLSWLPYMAFLQNFWMATRNTLGSYGLGATWSLSVEEQFYLTLPLLVRLLTQRRLVYALLVGVLFAPLLRILIHANWPTQHVAWHVLMPCRADALLLGVLGAVAVREEFSVQWLRAHQRLFWALAPVLLIGLVVLTVKSAMPSSFMMLTGGYTWLAFSYLCLLLYAVLFSESWIGHCLRWSWLRWLGSIAYGAYLFHAIVYGAIFGAIWAGPPLLKNLSTTFVAFLALGATLLLCHISWIYFERPLVKVGHRSRYHFEARPPLPKPSTPAAAASLS